LTSKILIITFDVGENFVFKEKEVVEIQIKFKLNRYFLYTNSNILGINITSGGRSWLCSNNDFDDGECK